MDAPLLKNDPKKKGTEAPNAQQNMATPAPPTEVDSLEDNDLRIEQWGGSWSDGLFDCFSHWPTCLAGCCCCSWATKALAVTNAKIMGLCASIFLFGTFSLLSTITGFAARRRGDWLVHFAGYDAKTPVAPQEQAQLTEMVFNDRWFRIFVIIGAVSFVLVFILNLVYRMKIRNMYNIQQNRCGEFFAVLCCNPCAVCQEYRHTARSRGFMSDVPPIVMQNHERLQARTSSLYRGIPKFNKNEYVSKATEQV